MFRHEPHGPQIAALTAQFKQAMKIADEYGVKIADENHIDYTADEMLQLIEGVGSPNFGINFDTGNFLRLLDDPIAGMEKLAPYVFATHIKDLQINYSAKPTDWYFFSTVPVGRGMIDNLKLAQMLKKANYQGFLAMELDMPHPDWAGCEDEAVSISVKNLREIAKKVG
jgi:sugar phosphate isomerase/epimerase